MLEQRLARPPLRRALLLSCGTLLHQVASLLGVFFFRIFLLDIFLLGVFLDIFSLAVTRFTCVNRPAGSTRGQKVATVVGIGEREFSDRIQPAGQPPQLRVAKGLEHLQLVVHVVGQRKLGQLFVVGDVQFEQSLRETTVGKGPTLNERQSIPLQFQYLQIAQSHKGKLADAFDQIVAQVEVVQRVQLLELAAVQLSPKLVIRQISSCVCLLAHLCAHLRAFQLRVCPFPAKRCHQSAFVCTVRRVGCNN